MSEPNPILKSFKESSGIRLSILFGSFFTLMIIASFIGMIINNFSFLDERSRLLIISVVQCLLAFILPFFLLAKFCSKNSLKWLKLDKKFDIKPYIGILIIYILSLPAMEWLVEWNSNINLPQSFSGLESLLRGWEESASSTTEILLQSDSIGSVISGILIIGFLTGFSEELFFRGALQGIFIRTKIGAAKSIWLAAFIFSFMHFQFFGFIPRLIMGAFFGYLLFWTSDLKTAAFAHILNNSMVVITVWLFGKESLTNETSLFPDFPVLPLASLVSTVLFLIFFRSFFFKGSSTTNLSWQKNQLPPVSGI